MIIAQVVLPGASEYERKSQRADAEALRGNHEVITGTGLAVASGANVAHLYGPRELPRALVREIGIPFVANGTVPRRRFSFGSVVEPAYVVSPLAGDGVELLAETVEPAYWEAQWSPLRQERKSIGSFARGANRNWIEQTMARIHRTRDDVDWLLFERPPAPAEIAALDLWVDPAMRDDDFDGFVAEALVIGVPVVGGRTPINAQRLEKGRTGTLVPPGDPNELTHAILTALFKPESVQQRLAAARQTISKFHPRQRLRVLLHMYETLTA